LEAALGCEDAGRVDEDELRLVLDDDAEDARARRLHLGRDDRHLGADELVDERRLAGIGGADQGLIAAARRLGRAHDRASTAASAAAAAAASAARFDEPLAVAGASPSTVTVMVKVRRCAGPVVPMVL